MVFDIAAAIAADPNIDTALRRVFGATAEQLDPTPLRRAAYVSALRRMDWTFENSDDQRRWRAARDELERLRAERVQVDPDGSLWKVNTPVDFQNC